jgi:alpha-N-acetylgalactosaminidase
MTDLVVSEGYAAAGYEYINVDDCWLEKSRGPRGELVADRKRFPSGMKSLSDYVHARGLKFGIYEDYGNYTCAGYPGILGFSAKDAALFASWEVDYVKLDGCYSLPQDMDQGYPEFGYHLNSTGRAMIYSCSWPVYQIYAGIVVSHSNLVLLSMRVSLLSTFSAQLHLDHSTLQLVAKL